MREQEWCGRSGVGRAVKERREEREENVAVEIEGEIGIGLVGRE